MTCADKSLSALLMGAVKCCKHARRRKAAAHSTLELAKAQNLEFCGNANWFVCRLLLSITCCAIASGCSKQVEWDEEVPLNLGTTIWVQRTATYNRVLSGPLAVQLKWRIGEETLSFQWAQKQYSYTTNRSDGLVPFVLFIDPKANEPVLIAPLGPPSNWGCHRPHYAQLRFRQSNWVMQTKLDPLMYGTPSNLSIARSQDPDTVPQKITSEQRHQNDSVYGKEYGAGFLTTVDPNYVTETCKGKV